MWQRPRPLSKASPMSSSTLRNQFPLREFEKKDQSALSSIKESKFSDLDKGWVMVALDGTIVGGIVTGRYSDFGRIRAINYLSAKDDAPEWSQDRLLKKVLDEAQVPHIVMVDWGEVENYKALGFIILPKPREVGASLLIWLPPDPV